MRSHSSSRVSKNILTEQWAKDYGRLGEGPPPHTPLQQGWGAIGLASQSRVCQKSKARTLIFFLPICLSLFSVSLSFFLSPIACPLSHVYLTSLFPTAPFTRPCLSLTHSLPAEEDASGSGEGHYADDWMAGAAAVAPPARPPRPPGRKGGFIIRQNQGRSRTGGASLGFHTQPILILLLSALALLGPR